MKWVPLWLVCMGLLPALPLNAQTTEQDRLAVVSSIIERWREGDVDGVMTHLHPDIVWHFAAGNAAPLRGGAAVREWLDGFVGKIAETRWRITGYAGSGNSLFVEGIEDYDTTDGHRIVVPYAGVFEFADGRVIGWRDYFDRGLGQRQREGEPVSDWVRELADRPVVAPE